MKILIWVWTIGCWCNKEKITRHYRKKIDFVVLNGEILGITVGITKKIFDEFINSGVDVVTTGNHVWDEKEAIEFISKSNRLLRPANLMRGSPETEWEFLLLKITKKLQY